MTPFPGMLGTTRTDSHRIASARSSAIAETRFALIPGAGRNSYMVTRGPVRISVIWPSMPCSASFDSSAWAFSCSVSSSTPSSTPLGGSSRSSGGRTNAFPAVRGGAASSGTGLRATTRGGAASSRASGAWRSSSHVSRGANFSLIFSRTFSGDESLRTSAGRPLNGRPVTSIRENRRRATSRTSPPAVPATLPRKWTPSRSPTTPGRKTSCPRTVTCPVKKLRIPRTEQTARSPPAARPHFPRISSPRYVQ